MQGRRSRPKNGLNGRASYLCFRAKMTHGREAEPENDAQPDLRKKLTPGEHDIIQRYRLNWQAIQQLLRNIEPQLAPTLVTPCTIPTETKLLALLHMLASVSFQTTGALVGGISQPSFSSFLPKVLDAIIGLTPRDIYFPNTLQKQQETKQRFYLISGFPHILGAIDCTHVRLVPPAATEHLYRNRKHTHSINVQAMVDHQGLITNIVAKYPGSVHDSYIFRHCTINEHFQDGQYGNGLLVADQGFGIQPWIMTPFGNPSTAAERAYNDAHGRTRSIVERTFGILKSRFRCLDITGGSLLYSPEMVDRIILTCAILHNICIKINIPLLEPEPHMPEEEEEEDAGLQQEGELQNTASGIRRRQQIVNNFF
ncbi:hypothetical protein NDU88_001640 [Pleurodeles waltl]|uniref:Putative nuclease HARBI1 n=1 Tax=Pleurodeles waltl TaxID=8319 RepID=A0AAV7UV97_PLEWA|nr:hypothetical protein NDU88_001640 [Pleurodeles waltl]